jgi:hypothetical protein
VKILLVSQMYPGPDAPDLGVFVAQLERALQERGHEVERAVLDSRRGGKLRYAVLGASAMQAARRFRPDVVYAHFLVPSGLLAGLSSRAPLVVTAHGRDVRNIGAIPGIATATRATVRRAAAVIAVSDYLRRELETKVPEAVGKTEVIDSGVDLERFAVQPAPEGGPHVLCIGALTERKNVVRLADAFARLGEGRLTFPRRRAAAPAPRRPAQRRPRRRCRPHRDPGAHRAGARRRSAEPDRALRPGRARGDGVGALGGGDAHRRAAGVRPGRSGRARRSARPRCTDARVASAAALPCPNVAARAAAEPHDVREQARRVEAVLERAASAAA